ncbi:MAG: hypothetical protein MJ016_02285 [Victivallaceae bacterium]|nr:hypothetical protein [Victivallaceae bacterium]
MDIYKIIIDALKKEYADGATYRDLAEKYGVSYQYIRELMLGVKPVERMSLDIFFKLFPSATVSIKGNTVNNVVNTGVNSGSMIGVNSAGDIEDKILKSDLSAEDKVKFIELVRK